MWLAEKRANAGRPSETAQLLCMRKTFFGRVGEISTRTQRSGSSEPGSLPESFAEPWEHICILSLGLEDLAMPNPLEMLHFL